MFLCTELAKNRNENFDVGCKEYGKVGRMCLCFECYERTTLLVYLSSAATLVLGPTKYAHLEENVAQLCAVSAFWFE